MKPKQAVGLNETQFPLSASRWRLLNSSDTAVNKAALLL